MSEFKGTKGEWEIGIVPDYNDTLKSAMLEVQSDSYWICKVQNNGMIGANEGKANALLISKAPELLHELKEFVHFVSDGFIKDYEGTFDERESECKERIAKAEQLIKSATETK